MECAGGFRVSVTTRSIASRGFVYQEPRSISAEYESTAPTASLSCGYPAQLRTWKTLTGPVTSPGKSILHIRAVYLTINLSRSQSNRNAKKEECREFLRCRNRL